MANTPRFMASQFARELHRSRGSQERITMRQLAECMIRRGFSVVRYRSPSESADRDLPRGMPFAAPGAAPSPPISDTEWLTQQLLRVEQDGDLALFGRDSDAMIAFINALAGCLPHATEIGDRLALALAADELEQFSLDHVLRRNTDRDDTQ